MSKVLTGIAPCLNCFLATVTVIVAVQSSSTAGAAIESDASADSAGLEFFERNVRPLLVTRCYACHSADTKPAGGLRVDDINGLLTGGNSGAAVVRGDVESSRLISRILPGSKRRMPQDSDPLSDEQIEILKQWIADGAIWPQIDSSKYLESNEDWYSDLRRHHWAWQPVSAAEVPDVLDDTWPRDDIDRFVLSALESRALRPVGDADRATLIRRVTFDLTGLPPTTAEVRAFVDDLSEFAFEKVVDRLLNSRAYGERWGRHWLDVARYAESTGPSRNIPYPHAWRYRDYVLNSFHTDVPFNRFLQEQIAGDLLPADSDSERDRLSIATGFLAIGVKDVNQRFRERFILDNVDEQIDVVSRAVLGLTVSCARCHDHKFDPIPTADYYALAGIFTSTEDGAGLRNQMGGSGLAYYVPSKLIPLNTSQPAPPPAEKVAVLTSKVAEAREKFEAIRGTAEGLAIQPNGRPLQRVYRDRLDKLQGQLNELTDPAARGGAVHGVQESGSVGDTNIRLRGEAELLGPVVPRGFLSIFDLPDKPTINPAQSGRKELAEWLTSANNPLTARVAVNRIWHHLFGQGIVPSVDNFGTMGDVPSHPELLDYLATQFVRDNWSFKSLIRRIVLTRTYQLGSSDSPAYLAVDPENKLLWRHSPRRLSAEELRDAMLAVSGELIQSPASGSPAQELQMREIRDNDQDAAKIHKAAGESRYRSVYLPLLRGLTPKPLEAFDPVEQTLVTGQRDSTTVPSQALFMLNSVFVHQCSASLADRLIQNSTLSDSERVATVWQHAFGRNPEQLEMAASIIFVEQFASAFELDRLRDVSGDADQSLSAAQKVVEGPGGVRGQAGPTSETGNSALESLIAAGDETAQNSVLAADEVAALTNSRQAAWCAFVQSVFGSAEFRYLR